jgi:predicted XRE-type DNA-binding protein
MTGTKARRSAKGPAKRATKAATKRTITRSGGNVFADLGFGAEEAEHLRIRSALMGTIRRVIQDRGLTQARAAVLLGVTQPRVSDLMRGKIDLFSIDTLVEMLARAGLRIEVRVAEGG